MRQRILYLLVLLALPLTLWAGNASNVRVQQKDKNIVITYDLKKMSHVRLLMSIEDGPFRTVRATEGAIGKNVHPGKNLTITWHPLQEQETFIERDVRFKVEAYGAYEAYADPNSPYNSGINTYILGQYAYSFAPQTSCGLVFGMTFGVFGLFVDARTNWNFNFIKGNNIVAKAEDEDGMIDGGVFPFYTGKTACSYWVAHAGLTANFPMSHNRFTAFGVYLGAGFGERRLCWETADGHWIQYQPKSYGGFSGNVGIMGSVYGLTVRAGVNTIMFKNLELEAAVGWTF